MEFLILFFIIFTIALSIRNYLQKKIEETIPIAVILITLVVYIAGLFDNLSIGVRIIEFISIIATIYNTIYIVKKIKNNQIKQEIEKILTPGLFIYVVFFIIFIIINNKRIFEEDDEFSHWGLIIKNMFMYNGYGTIENSKVKFNEYPPFTASFQYILLKLKNVYSEDLVIIAHNILYLSIIIPICKKVDFEKNFRNLILIVPAIIIIPMIFYANFYTNILVDGILGIFFAMGLFVIYEDDENKKYKTLMLTMIITALALTKTTGIILATFLVIFEFIKEIINKNEKSKLCFIILIVPLVLTLAWYIKINISNNGTVWNFNKVIKYEYQNKDTIEITKEYIKAFFTKQVISFHNLTVFSCVLALIAYSLYIYQTRKSRQEKKNYIYIMIGHASAFIIFLIGLLWMYLTIFTDYESSILACYWRYASTLILSWMMINTLILCNEDKIKIMVSYVFIVILMIFIPTNIIKDKYIDKKEYIKYLNTQRENYVTMSKYREVFSENDKVFFISNVMNPFILRINRYELTEVNIANDNANIVYPVEQFTQILLNEKYKYVYIYKTENNFIDENKGIFENENIQEHTLYKVCVDEKENIQLIKNI